MFTLVTSNEEKIYFARKALDRHNIDFKTINLEITEIQADSPDELILHKANSAFEKLKEPLVVNDHWWEFKALNGFPGPYMHFMNDHLTSDDILRLMHGKKDRRVVAKEYICYQDKNTVKIFFDNIEGIMLEKAEGNGLPGQQILSIAPDRHSIAYHLNHKTDPRGTPERKVWSDLANWLSNK